MTLTKQHRKAMSPCLFLSFPKCQGVWQTCGIYVWTSWKKAMPAILLLILPFLNACELVIDIGNKNKIAKAMSSTLSKSKDKPQSKHKNQVIITFKKFFLFWDYKITVVATLQASCPHEIFRFAFQNWLIFFQQGNQYVMCYLS